MGYGEPDKERRGGSPAAEEAAAPPAGDNTLFPQGAYDPLEAFLRDANPVYRAGAAHALAQGTSIASTAGAHSIRLIEPSLPRGWNWRRAAAGILAPGDLPPRLPEEAMLPSGFPAPRGRRGATNAPGHSGGTAPDSHRLPFHRPWAAV